VASETVYVTAADAEGNMVSLINSVYDNFRLRHRGARDRDSLLQNRGAGFTR
jgi:gamma-glutamyltranspeptidase